MEKKLKPTGFGALQKKKVVKHFWKKMIPRLKVNKFQKVFINSIPSSEKNMRLIVNFFVFLNTLWDLSTFKDTDEPISQEAFNKLSKVRLHINVKGVACGSRQEQINYWTFVHCTGATDTTAVAPKFSDILNLYQPDGGGGRFCPTIPRISLWILSDAWHLCPFGHFDTRTSPTLICSWT